MEHVDARKLIVSRSRPKPEAVMTLDKNKISVLISKDNTHVFGVAEQWIYMLSNVTFDRPAQNQDDDRNRKYL